MYFFSLIFKESIAPGEFVFSFSIEMLYSLRNPLYQCYLLDLMICLISIIT